MGDFRKELSERDICTKFITPALIAGNKWDLMGQIREEVSFTKGRVIVRGPFSTRGEAKRADYLLSYKPGIQLAVVEAKDNNREIISQRQRGCIPRFATMCYNPVGVDDHFDSCSQGGSCLATLGWMTQPRWGRLAEANLHLLKLLGGWPGAFLAQRRLGHKCSKGGYQFVFWLIVLGYQFAAYDSFHAWRYSQAAWKYVEQTSKHRQ